MVNKIKYLLIALHVLSAFLIAVWTYTYFRYALIEKGLNAEDPKWGALAQMMGGLVLGVWGMIVLIAIIATIKQTSPRRKSAKRLVIALLGPPFYYMVASIYIPEIVVRM